MKRLSIFLVLVSIFALANAQTFKNTHFSLPDLYLSVSSFADVDNDGDLDLYLAGYSDDVSSVAGGLYIYEGSDYVLSESSGLPAVFMGSCFWADINGDGFLDIVIMGEDASYTEITEVYQNNGDGTFTSLNAGLLPAEQGEINFVDFDGDNDLDIAYTGYNSDDSDITKFYKNNGTGVFTEAIESNVPGMNWGRMKWADYDNDNDLDFLLSGYNNELDTFYTKIFKNNGDGTFVVSNANFFQCWLGDTEWGDFNDDGNIDLVISGTGGDGTERHTYLYKNNGDGTFTQLDVAFPGVSHSSLEWADFNNDSTLDLFIVGETTTPGEGNSVSKIFINNGDETFTDSGVDNLNYSFYGDADAGDYDNDGKIDLVITGYLNPNYESASAVFKNTTDLNISEINIDVSIYPTPANEFFTIKSSSTINKIEIFDISGKKILSKNANSKRIKMNIQNLTSGLYLLKIQTTSKIISKKLIVE